MAYQKLLGQATRALRIIPSDVGDIPFPGDHYASGTNSATDPNTATTAYDGGATLSTVTLIDATADFIALGVEQGDIVYNVGSAATTAGAGRVVEVVNDTKLKVLTSDVVTVAIGWAIEYAGTGIPYKLYRQPKEPCMVYPIGANKSMQAPIITAGGDALTLTGNAPPQLLNSPYVGVQLRRVVRDGCYIDGTVGTLWMIGVW